MTKKLHRSDFFGIETEFFFKNLTKRDSGIGGEFGKFPSERRQRISVEGEKKGKREKS